MVKSYIRVTFSASFVRLLTMHATTEQNLQLATCNLQLATCSWCGSTAAAGAVRQNSETSSTKSEILDIQENYECLPIIRLRVPTFQPHFFSRLCCFLNTKVILKKEKAYPCLATSPPPPHLQAYHKIQDQSHPIIARTSTQISEANGQVRMHPVWLYDCMTSASTLLASGKVWFNCHHQSWGAHQLGLIHYIHYINLTLTSTLSSSSLPTFCCIQRYIRNLGLSGFSPSPSLRIPRIGQVANESIKKVLL